MLDVVLGVFTLAAVASLILEHGWYEGQHPVDRGLLHIANVVIGLVFVADRFLRLGLSRDRTRYVRENWIDFLLMALALIACVILQRLAGQPIGPQGQVLPPATTLCSLVLQLYMLAVVLLRAMTLNLHLTESGIHPTWMLIASFATLCLIGSGLLMLPVATPEPASVHYLKLDYPEALFTSVSATCVTGLVMRDVGLEFSRFGQTVIMALFQLGGLGIMLFGTVLATFAGRSLTFRGSRAMAAMVMDESYGHMASAARFIVITTLTIEAIGAAFLYPMFLGAPGITGQPNTAIQAAWMSIFHSISSFCNAGFSLYGGNMFTGVNQHGWSEPLRNHWQIMGIIAPLIVLGGLGFPVLSDCAQWVRRRLFGVKTPVGIFDDSVPTRYRLSLHTRLVLWTTILLIPLGAAGLILVETNPGPGGAPSERYTSPESLRNDWRDMPTSQQVKHAVFQSMAARTAGFNTIKMDELTDAGKLWTCVLMVIGGSPASTAGGLKTTTFVLLLVIVWSVMRRRDEVEVFKRAISYELIRRVVTSSVMFLTLVGLVTLLLSIAMRPGFAFIDILFEACSACGTVGLSTGVTPMLTDFGKYVLIAGMFIGRLGVMTVLLAMVTSVRHTTYSYPAEGVVIG